MKRAKHIFNKVIDTDNIKQAIYDVNSGHRGRKEVDWVEDTIDDRIEDLRNIILNGYTKSETRKMTIYDKNAKKYRDIEEPKLWPDQYIHHMIIQPLISIMMRGMDDLCCGSIPGRGTQLGIKYIKRCLHKDKKNTKYAAELDIHHFYASVKPEVIMNRMKSLIKDKKMLNLIEILVKDGLSIGAYYSQWFANTVLQPLDHFIREELKIKYYVRYMDNLTLFHNNKKKLHKAVRKISEYLKSMRLRFKDNWQVFKVDSRMVSAMGYRFDHEKTLIRKHNLMNIKKTLHKLYHKMDHDQPITVHEAQGIISRLGMLKHCDSTNIYNEIVRTGFVKQMKQIIKEDAKQKRNIIERKDQNGISVHKCKGQWKRRRCLEN